MYGKQKPSVEPLESPRNGERHTHPAFGVISVAKGTAGQGGIVLFGSDLNHRSVLTVTVSTATLDRHLNRDWLHSETDVIQFQMSEAQWASFVSAQGGAAIPITFERRPADDAPTQLIPQIEKHETLIETFEREVREKCEGYIATATELADRLKQCSEEGKMNKGTMKELLAMATKLSVGMPNSMGFVQKQMREAMEKNVTAGKIEMEAFVDDLAKRKGLEALREQAPTLIEQARKPDAQTE